MIRFQINKIFILFQLFKHVGILNALKNTGFSAFLY